MIFILVYLSYVGSFALNLFCLKFVSIFVSADNFHHFFVPFAWLILKLFFNFDGRKFLKLSIYLVIHRAWRLRSWISIFEFYKFEWFFEFVSINHLLNIGLTVDCSLKFLNVFDRVEINDQVRVKVVDDFGYFVLDYFVGEDFDFEDLFFNI